VLWYVKIESMFIVCIVFLNLYSTTHNSAIQ